MGKRVDQLLKLSVVCPKDELVEVADAVCRAIDEAERTNDTGQAALLRDLSKVIDGIGDLRFSPWWASHSPARKRDIARMLTLTGVKQAAH